MSEMRPMNAAPGRSEYYRRVKAREMLGIWRGRWQDRSDEAVLAVADKRQRPAAVAA